MVQSQIIRIIAKHKCLLSVEIIQKIKTGDGAKEYVRQRLKQLRKYGEVNFVLVTHENQEEMANKFPHLRQHLDNGYKIRRPTFLYYE